MKVCPSCDRRYENGAVFCEDDGEMLVATVEGHPPDQDAGDEASDDRYDDAPTEVSYPEQLFKSAAKIKAQQEEEDVGIVEDEPTQLDDDIPTDLEFKLAPMAGPLDKGASAQEEPETETSQAPVTASGVEFTLDSQVHTTPVLDFEDMLRSNPQLLGDGLSPSTLARYIESGGKTPLPPAIVKALADSSKLPSLDPLAAGAGAPEVNNAAEEAKASEESNVPVEEKAPEEAKTAEEAKPALPGATSFVAELRAKLHKKDGASHPSTPLPAPKIGKPMAPLPKAKPKPAPPTAKPKPAVPTAKPKPAPLTAKPKSAVPTAKPKSAMPTAKPKAKPKSAPPTAKPKSASPTAKPKPAHDSEKDASLPDLPSLPALAPQKPSSPLAEVSTSEELSLSDLEFVIPSKNQAAQAPETDEDEESLSFVPSESEPAAPPTIPPAVEMAARSPDQEDEEGALRPGSDTRKLFGYNRSFLAKWAGVGLGGVALLAVVLLWTVSGSDEEPPAKSPPPVKAEQDSAVPDIAGVDKKVAVRATPVIPEVDAAVPDSAVPDSAVPDSAVPDSAPPDSDVPEKTFFPEKRPQREAAPKPVIKKRKPNKKRKGKSILKKTFDPFAE